MDNTERKKKSCTKVQGFFYFYFFICLFSVSLRETLDSFHSLGI